MHNSQDGQLVDDDSPNGNDWLLVDASPSDVCLQCHASRFGAVLGNDPLAPPDEKGGGNFVFLTEDNLNDGHNGGLPANWIPGHAAGHNLDAPGHGLDTDPVLRTAPGGDFPSSILACSSCHDPHGNQNFRLLYGAGRVQPGANDFVNPAPTAEGISLFFGAESPANHTAYQGGMSDWCGNCHPNFHDNNTALIHPSGSTLGGTIATAYGLYNGSDDVTGGDPATSYLPATPFEDSSMTTSSTGGPAGTSTVMCLTCHRAHATSAADAGRWDFDVTFLEEDGHESGAYPIPNPYGPNQRSLCNKCHVQDADDAPMPPITP
jgi:nitrate reductase cytochrome c-type subunit